jgi:hypothetical protein
MIDLNDVIAGVGLTGIKSARKAFRGHCGRRNPVQTNFRFRCDNQTRLNPASTTKPKQAILESVTQDALLTQSTFNPLPGVLLAIALVLTVGFVAGVSDGKVMTSVGALVWFYILFYSEPMHSSSSPMSVFDASHRTDRRSSDRIDSRAGHMSNTVSTAVWSLMPPSRHALTYAALTSSRPHSGWNT